jgi:rhodanese-related sulfurtransferase
MSTIKGWGLALVAVILAGCGPAEEQLVEAQAASGMQSKGALLLDIRDSDDYQEFHAPNSTNIPFGRMSQRLAELESYKGKEVIVIDHAGVRAPRALEVLQKAGFSRVFVVKGGMLEWQAAKLPVEKPQPPAAEEEVMEEEE